MGRKLTTLSLPLFALFSVACGGTQAELGEKQSGLGVNQSELWGQDGELFDAAGRVMDWSYAGYHAGEAPLPSAPVTISVNATADDAGDDTQEFQEALAQATAGDVVSVPAGHFVISDTLVVESGVVLRGAGPDKTILEVPVNLTDLHGNPGLDSGGQSSYSFGGGFIEAKGGDGGSKLSDVTAAAARGSHALTLATTAGISVGDWVEIEQTDVGGELMARLHADLLEGGSDNVGDKGMEFYSRVSAITADGIQLERALPLDIETQWSPIVKSVAPKTQEVGIEELAIEFPETTYPGHFEELGYNAIHLHGVQDSWVRNVRIVNADYGVNVTSSQFVTVQGVVVETTNQRTGHHALNNGHGGDNLFIDFDLRVEFVHDITNEWYATGIVVTRGRGDNLAMDHHRAAPYTTLWTEVDCGTGARPFQSGGSNNRGPHTAAYDTLWNVTASADMKLPPDDFGPRMNFVGFRTAATTLTSPYEWWMESIEPAELDPPNLWLAMRDKRLGPAGSGGSGGSNAGGNAGSGNTAGASGGAPNAGGGGGKSGGASAAPGASEDDEGCGCRTAKGPRHDLALWGLLLAASTILIRRRRSS